MCIGSNETDVTLGNDWIKRCVKFKYLGSVSVKRRTFGEDIETRVTIRKPKTRSVHSLI